MSRQSINTGTVSNDGTGDTLKEAGIKINDNFSELYYRLGGDSDSLSEQMTISLGTVVFEGSSTDNNETSLSVVDPTSDNSILLPDDSGTVVLNSNTQTMSNKTLLSPIITTPQINDATSTHQYVFVTSELSADRNVNLPILTDSDTFVFSNATQTLSNKTLVSPILDGPRIGQYILDSDGAELIRLTSYSSAVCEVEISNSTTGNNPKINAESGVDSDVSLELSGQNNGAIILNKPAVKSEILTGATVTVSQQHGFTVYNRATAISATLGDGSVVGEMKYFASRGNGTVTTTYKSITSPTDTFVLNKGETSSLCWDGIYWYEFN